VDGKNKFIKLLRKLHGPGRVYDKNFSEIVVPSKFIQIDTQNLMTMIAVLAKETEDSDFMEQVLNLKNSTDNFFTNSKNTSYKLWEVLNKYRTFLEGILSEFSDLKNQLENGRLDNLKSGARKIQNNVLELNNNIKTVNNLIIYLQEEAKEISNQATALATCSAIRAVGSEIRYKEIIEKENSCWRCWIESKIWVSEPNKVKIAAAIATISYEGVLNYSAVLKNQFTNIFRTLTMVSQTLGTLVEDLNQICKPTDALIDVIMYPRVVPAFIHKELETEFGILESIARDVTKHFRDMILAPPNNSDKENTDIQKLLKHIKQSK
jgi:hypothetical protein